MSESDSDDQAPKRRRKISNLTEQQVKHKRDLDRKAQRALRQRTKSRIQDLETSYAQLEASKSESETVMLRDLESLRAQNRQLKAKLAHISLFAAQGDSLPDQATAATGDVQSPPISTQNEGAVGHTSLECSPISRNNHGQILGDVSTDQNQRHESQGLAADSHQINGLPWKDQISYYGDQIAQERFNTNNHMIISSSSPPSAMDPEFSMYKETVTIPSQRATQHSVSADSCSSQVKVMDQYLDGSPTRPIGEEPVPSLSPVSSKTAQTTFYHESSGRSHNVSSFLSKHLPATCPLDQILLDFLSSRQALVAGGNPMDPILGPEQPFVAAILHPELAATAHPISRVMAEVLSTFPKVDLPEKISFMYLMHGTMKWQISPTREHYLRLPHWLRPTASQITIRHAAWLDNIPWPRVRDLLLDNPEKYPFQRFSDVYSRNVTVNWPFEAMDTVTGTSDGTPGDLVLNPLFEKHIRRLKNWTVSRYFETEFPELTAAVYSQE